LKDDEKLNTILLWIILSIFVLAALGTMSMLFLGIGDVREDERLILIYTFLIEVGGATASLFYSQFKISKNSKKNDSNIKYNVNNIFYSGSDTMLLIKSIETNQQKKLIIHYAEQVIHQMESSGFANNISSITRLKKKIKIYKDVNKEYCLSIQEREKLKLIVMDMKKAFSQNMRNVQKNYISHSKNKSFEKWDEGKSTDFIICTSNKSEEWSE
jgi:predicted membrane-bound spermidine synthase